MNEYEQILETVSKYAKGLEDKVAVYVHLNRISAFTCRMRISDIIDGIVLDINPKDEVSYNPDFPSEKRYLKFGDNPAVAEIAALMKLKWYYVRAGVDATELDEKICSLSNLLSED